MKSIRTQRVKWVAGIWICCVVAFLLIHFLVLLPQSRLIERTERELTLKKRIFEHAFNAAQPSTTDLLHKQIENSGRILEGLVMDTQDSAELVFDISRISNAIGLSSFSITATKRVAGMPEDPNTVIDEKHVHVGFTGGFDQFAAFLNALERWRPAILVDTFRITRSSRENSGHAVNMRLAILVEKGTAVSASAGMAPVADSFKQAGQLR